MPAESVCNAIEWLRGFAVAFFSHDDGSLFGLGLCLSVSANANGFGSLARLKAVEVFASDVDLRSTSMSNYVYDSLVLTLFPVVRFHVFKPTSF